MAVSPRPPRRRPGPSVRHRRVRALALLILAVVVGTTLGLRVSRSGDDAGHQPEAGRDPSALLPGATAGEGVDPLRYTPARRAGYEARATAGLAHVLYAKSPGGAVATAQRVAGLRPLIEHAAQTGNVNADTLEAIVFLESAGRADALADPKDLRGAAGLTQILAETATGFLGLRVDVRASARLTRGIGRGRKVEERERERRRVDERFDPVEALAATARYLRLAEKAFARNGNRDDLAVASYHMGIGNLQNALRRYGDDRASYAELFFGTSPVTHPRAYAFLAGLNDDSATYLWRVRAAAAIMAQYRSDPEGLAAVAALQIRKNSAEEVLHPEGSVPSYRDPFALGRARAAGTLLPLPAAQLARYGVRASPAMGELAPRLHQSRRLYRALRPEALATLLYLGAAAQGISGRGPLIVTSTVRDRSYQRLLTAANIEATKAYSLHTTGFSFDIARQYGSGDAAEAFQFALNRLTALNMIAWVREPGAIHVTVGPLARELLPLLRDGAPVPATAAP